MTSGEGTQANSDLILQLGAPVKFYEGGLLISRGDGQHMAREGGIGCFDLIFVSEGLLPIQEGNHHFEVEAGQTLLLWPHRRHAGTRPFSPDMKMYWLHFDLKTHSSFAQNAQSEPSLNVPQYTTVARPEILEGMWRRLLDDQASGRLLPHYGNLLLGLILSEIADTRGTETTDLGAALASRALTFIRAHLNQPLSASLVAEQLGYNSEYLNRVFQRIYHHTLTEEIHLSRLGYARHLLLHSSKNILEISLSCGFNDVKYFSRLFKRYQGMTPTTFRRLHARAEVNYE